MTIGERLREARQERNITLDDVVRRTNIRPHFLRAIDNDQLGEIPESHRRLFVREYARVVGLDPAIVLEELPEISPAVVAPEVAARAIATPRVDAKPSPRPVSPTSSSLTRLRANPTMVAGVAMVLLMVAAIYYFVTMDESSGAELAEVAGDTISSATEILSSPTVAAGDTSALEPIVLEPGDSLTLEGRAIERVWYTIVADGKRSDFGTLDSGAVKTWRAAEVFKVSLGNAGGLQFFLNERPLGTLGPRSAVVRARLIDATGVRTTPRPATPQPRGGAAAPVGAPAGATPVAAGTGGRTSVVRSDGDGRSTPRAPRRRTNRRTNTALREVSPTDLR